MADLNIDKYLEHKEGKPINKIVYKVLRNIVARSQALPMNLEIRNQSDINRNRGPFIVLSNHTSRCDWEYIGMAIKRPLNFVASNIEFHRAHMHGIFNVSRVIPKKNFVADFHCIKEIMQIIHAGGNVILFPEGKSSISGTNQPITPGTSKLLKKLGVPVYTTCITGGYMSNTQWNIANRPGKVIITVKKLFTPDEAKTLPLDEMDKRITSAIYNDDFEWNKTARIKFKGNDTVAVKLEEHLFMCPRCKNELSMHGEKNVFKCSACGNGVTINEYYDLIPLDDNCVVPKNMRVWYELQRREVYRAVKNNPDFYIEEKVKLGIQPTDHYVDKTVTAEIVGEGVMKLTRKEFSYVGTKNGEPFEIHSPTVGVMSMVMSTDSSYFGGFFEGLYYEFQPERPVITKFLLAIEECHRLAGGIWQNDIPQQQWIYEDDKESDLEEYYLPTNYFNSEKKLEKKDETDGDDKSKKINESSNNHVSEESGGIVDLEVSEITKDAEVDDSYNSESFEDDIEPEIIDYFEDEYQEYWRGEIKRAGTEDSSKLVLLLENNSFKSVYGEKSKLYLLTDGESIISYCIFAEKIEQGEECFSPCISSIYTYPAYQNYNYAEKLISHICENLKKENDGESVNLYFVISNNTSSKNEQLLNTLNFNFSKSIEQDNKKIIVYCKNL